MIRRGLGEEKNSGYKTYCLIYFLSICNEKPLNMFDSAYDKESTS